MDINKFLLKNDKGLPSITMTMFTLGCLTAFTKLLLAGMSIGSFTMGAFTGIEAAAFVTALGGVYAYRRTTDVKNQTVTTETKEVE
jgi:uncharacterized membrane protein (DUF485 family)